MADLPHDFIVRCKAVTAKRPRIVIEHILERGHITTDELKTLYGYNHPPRAARDVREQGIPLEMYRVEGPDGRRIAAYRFGDPTTIVFRGLSGRTALARELKQKLIAEHGAKCSIYLEPMAEAELQIDHRIPYEVAGEPAAADASEFILLCGSANRAKSWSCEHCENWQTLHDPAICRTCYWAFPEAYDHVAMKAIRRVDIIWQDQAVGQYDQIRREADFEGKSIPQFVKDVLSRVLNDDH